MRLHMHPISVLENIWKRLFLLLIPLIRGVAFIFSPEGFRAWLSGAWLDLLVILFILTASYINWRCKTYQVEANQLIIRTGVLIRRESCIPKKAIATLSESIPFYMRPFRAVRVYVDTDGGLAQRVDVKLTVREKDMPVLQQLQDAKPVAPFLKRGYSPRWYEVAFMSICVSSALGSAVYAALFIRQAGKIFGEDILELLRFRLEHAAEYLIFYPADGCDSGNRNFRSVVFGLYAELFILHEVFRISSGRQAGNAPAWTFRAERKRMPRESH